MPTDLESIKKTLVGISRGDTIIDTLLEFERTLDNLEVFAYKNWILGELVEGPEIGRYFYTTTWMYPYKHMPDPNGGLRLTKIGAKVSYEKSMFKRPVKVKGPEDWVDPQTKRAKMIESKVWLVTIELPIKYTNHGLDQSAEIIQRDLERANQELAGSYGDGEEAGEEEMPIAMPQEINGAGEDALNGQPGEEA
jgi:hypothetical protein